MKRIGIYIFIIVMSIILSGCSKKNILSCNKVEVSSENLELNESLNITFKGREVIKMSIYSEIKISGSYINYIEDLSQSLKEQYKNLEGKKGVTFQTNQTENRLSVTINAELKKMDKEAKKELSIGNTRQSLSDTKKELELEGYACYSESWIYVFFYIKEL